MRSLVRTSESTAEPVSLTEVKAHLRIATSSTADDSVLSVYLKSARTLAENMTCRALVPSEYRLSLDEFSDTMVLPRSPLTSSSTGVAITYYDSSNAIQTLGTSVYTVDVDSEPGKVYLAPDQDWPDSYDKPGAVLINFDAGYAAASAVPIPIRQWIMVRTGQMYEFREPLLDGRAPGEIPRDFVDGLLDPYVLPEVDGA